MRARWIPIIITLGSITGCAAQHPAALPSAHPSSYTSPTVNSSPTVNLDSLRNYDYGQIVIHPPQTGQSGGGGGSGTVTSVNITVPSFLSVAGCPITVSGTCAISLTSQSANLVFASPNGSSGAPTFRQLVAADIPTLNYAPLTSGSSILYANGSGGFSSVVIGSNLTFSGGTLSASGSGGGSPGGSNTDCQYNNSSSFGGVSSCTYNGTTWTISNLTLGNTFYFSALSSDPGSPGTYQTWWNNTSKYLALYDGSTKWEMPTCSATGSAQIVELSTSGCTLTTLSPLIDSALGSTQGDILYRGASSWTVLAPGTSGYVLQTQGSSANPAWANVSGGSGCSTSGSLPLFGNGSGGCGNGAIKGTGTTLNTAASGAYTNGHLLSADSNSNVADSGIPSSAYPISDLASIANNTVLCNTSGSSAAPSACTALPTRGIALYTIGNCQNTTASIATNLQTSGTPTAHCITGSNVTLGTAQYTATTQQVQGTLQLPPDLATTSGNLYGSFTGETTSSGNVVWTFGWACVAAGGTLNPSLTTNTQTVTVSAGTANQLNTFNQNGITLTGCAANDIMFWSWTLTTMPTTSGNQDMISLGFLPLRNVTIGG